jgi:probable rRNA maturation factor
MIFLENDTDFSFETDRLELVAGTQTQRDIELILCDDKAIASLNHAHRGIDHPTDVLSFPLTGEHPHMPLGTVVISIDHAQIRASELGHDTHEEILLLFLHGLLHLLGHDHENDEGQMRQKEHELIRQFSLPDSLIIRTETP